MLSGRITATSPALVKPLRALNEGKPYAAQIKPFNFILACHERKLGKPIGADPAHFHLIASYETDARRWEKLQWIDQYSGKRYRISTTGAHGSRMAARVKNYGDLLREYEFHPEAKCADATAKVCGKQSVGLLSRRHVLIELLRFIGKESNHLEELEEKSFLGPTDVYVEYPDPLREHERWLRDVVPKLRASPLSELQSLTGTSRASLRAIRSGRLPHAKNRVLLRYALCRGRLGRGGLGQGNAPRTREEQLHANRARHNN